MGKKAPVPNTCDTCNGSGEFYPDMAVKVDGAVFAHRFLKPVCDLPDCEIGVVEKTRFALFRYDGGYGLIMAILWDRDVGAMNIEKCFA
jgi:hypothetical protein